MRLGFLELPDDERGVYLQEAAARLDLSPVVLEKDFWVCWLLGALFESPFAGGLVFKGGTSLSKVFGVIERFSEDIDLSLSPEFLGLPPAGASRTQAGKWMKKAEAECAGFVESRIAPVLEAVAQEVLGGSGLAWLEFLLDANSRSPVLLFHYPSVLAPGLEYLRRSVKLEFGSLTDQQPAGRHPVRPWVADALPDAFGDWRCEVTTLEVERTCWEKATILHAEHHRPAGKTTPDRYSRHYADTAALAEHQLAAGAWDNHELCGRVVRFKSRFFGSDWARYDLAAPGTFRLVPPGDRLPALRRDYEAMRDMYLAEPVPFDDVLRTLAELEDRINR